MCYTNPLPYTATPHLRPPKVVKANFVHCGRDSYRHQYIFLQKKTQNISDWKWNLTTHDRIAHSLIEWPSTLQKTTLTYDLEMRNSSEIFCNLRKHQAECRYQQRCSSYHADTQIHLYQIWGFRQTHSTENNKGLLPVKVRVFLQRSFFVVPRYLTLNALTQSTCDYTNACLYLINIHQMVPPQTEVVDT